MGMAAKSPALHAVRRGVEAVKAYWGRKCRGLSTNEKSRLIITGLAPIMGCNLTADRPRKTVQ